MGHSFDWLPQSALSDSRYDPAAYAFLLEALELTSRRLAKKRGSEIHHVTGQELLEGVRIWALNQFGLMAKTVLNTWGIHTTSDVGEMVFRLVDAGDLAKTEQDKRSDFDNIYDFDTAFCEAFRIEPDDLKADS